jgi:hypothetical protein
MLVGEHGSDPMVPRIAKALQREATAASARAGNAPRPTSSFADASCSATLASAPDVRSAGFTGYTKRTRRAAALMILSR